MKFYQGIIEEISPKDPYKTGHTKKIVKIREDDNQTSFIEFFGDRMVKILENFTPLDRVTIVAVNKASESSKSGTRFNNILAKTIKKNQ